MFFFSPKDECSLNNDGLMDFVAAGSPHGGCVFSAAIVVFSWLGTIASIFGLPGVPPAQAELERGTPPWTSTRG